MILITPVDLLLVSTRSEPLESIMDLLQHPHRLFSDLNKLMPSVAALHRDTRTMGLMHHSQLASEDLV